MSMPKFPHEKISTEDALNLILASIAMEEAGLSHIINAEGEKLQYILGTLHCGQRPCADTEDILRVNDSVRRLLDTVTQNQIILKSKMESALAALEKFKKKNNDRCCGCCGCNKCCCFCCCPVCKPCR